MRTTPRNNAENNSTVVRILGWQLKALSALSPALAERRALQLFRTPVRRGRGRVPALHGWAGESLPVTVNGQRVSAWEWGDEGPVTLLVHGWNGHAGQLAPLAEALLDAGERVVLFDHVGHGNSEGREATLLDLRDAILEVARRAGGVRAVVGHSLGATALALALDQGLKAERAVLIAPAAEMAHYTHTLVQRFDLPEARSRGMLALIEKQLAALGEGTDVMSVPKVARRLSVPALLLHDREDREVPFEHGARIAAAWPGARLEEIPGAGHTRALRDPRVRARVLEFLEAA